MLFRIPPDERRTGAHQQRLIYMLEPRLLDWPFNPTTDELGAVDRVRWHWGHDPVYPARWLWRRVMKRVGQ